MTAITVQQGDIFRVAGQDFVIEGVKRHSLKGNRVIVFQIPGLGFQPCFNPDEEMGSSVRKPGEEYKPNEAPNKWADQMHPDKKDPSAV